MTDPAVQYAGTAIIEVGTRTHVCVVPGCGGTVVRHPLGVGQAVDRCVRCFRRYRLRTDHAAEAPAPSKLRRWLDDFVSWRE